MIMNLMVSKQCRVYFSLQNLVNLNILWLESSKDLIEIPDLSRATNLRKVYLFECESLCQLHPSIFSLPRLTYLCLGNCKKIESLKTNIHSKSLCVLLLDGCSSLMEFSVTSEEMTQLTLRGTAIRKLSSSIWRNCKLTSLDLTECNKLNIVEKKLSDDHGLGSVTELDLSGCTEIDASSLWSILDGIQSLKRLKLTECCNLESLPENIQNHSMLKWLDLDDCRKLASLTELPPSLLYLKAVNCTYLDADSTQRSLLENMVQTFSKDPPYEEDDDFSFLPGAQVPCKFDFQTIESSITISPIPKFGLRGFIFCIILSEGFHVYHHSLHCIIFEHGKEVDRFRIVHEYTGTLISDHLLICWHGYNILESGSNDCNLSFQFILQGPNEELRWSTEGIKGCGVLPVYNLERGLDLDGGEIGKLKFSAEYPEGFDWPWENHNDELQPRAFEGEVRSSNNENEDDQKHSCCSIGMKLFTHFLIINSILFLLRKSLILQMNNCLKFFMILENICR